MPLVHPSPLLRRVLWADATVSGAVALLQLAAAAVALVLEPAALGVGFLLMHVAAVLLFAALERAGLQQSPAASPGAALAR